MQNVVKCKLKQNHVLISIKKLYWGEPLTSKIFLDDELFQQYIKYSNFHWKHQIFVHTQDTSRKKYESSKHSTKAIQHCINVYPNTTCDKQ